MNPLTHLKKRRILTLVIVPAVIVGAVLISSSAHATPGCGVVSTNILLPVQAGFFVDDSLDLRCKSQDFDWDLKTKVKGDSDLYITENTFQPGGQVGWHTHPGPSLITVTQGTLTVYTDDCTFQTYSAGESFTDLGCGDIHNIRNETGAEARSVAVQLVPHGAARRQDKPDPGCSQVPVCQ
jgi:quercetin dioxygenase-like cupin family protein